MPKEDAVNLCRWFGVLDNASFIMRNCVPKRICQVMLFSTIGLIDESFWRSVQISSDKMLEEIEKHALLTADFNQQVQNFKEDKEPFYRMQAATNNGLQVSLAALMDPHFKRVWKILLSVFEPLRLWHGRQRKMNRSVREQAQWQVDQLMGVPAGVYVSMLTKLDDTVALEQMGFKLFVPGSAGLDLRQSLIVEEDFYAKLVANLTLGGTGNRYRRLLYALRGWPGRSVGFAPTLPELFEETLQAFKHD